MSIRILTGDCRDVLRTLEDESVNCCVTSPPYFGLRDYGVDGQIGLEQTPDEYVSEMVAVFREVRRVLRDDGTLWLNLGDSYANGGSNGSRQGCGPNPNMGKMTRNRDGVSAGELAAKQLIGIPWRVAFALQADGWYLRQDIIWSKPNRMPESVKDRCTKAHEYVFMLSKLARYFYDADAIAEDAIYSGLTGQSDNGFKDPQAYSGKHSKPDKQRGHSRHHAGFNDRWDAMEKTQQCSGKRNKRSVWSIATQPFSEAHFATMAPELAETCIKAGCPQGGVVLDPFGGAGTTGLCADRLGRKAVLIELNPQYVAIARNRLTSDAGMFANVS